MTVSHEVAALFADKGKSAYFGEAVSQLEHALQAAYFARQERAPAHLVVAALVHDIGHLVEDIPEDTADLGIDAKHEEIGESWLAKRFGPEVYQPVQLHVSAKRYLCATVPEYMRALSPASLQSLRLQGGPMSDDEIANFEAQRFFKEAVQMRRWDDRAKIPDLKTPDLSTYLDDIDGAAAPKRTGRATADPLQDIQTS